MSGTSLDGVDIADVLFTKEDNDWRFEVLHTKEYGYPNDLFLRLQDGVQLSSEELLLLSNDLGSFYGDLVNRFVEEFKLDRNDIDAVSSHGQTIFHQPEKSFTLQIGNGPQGAVKSGLKWVCDFRVKDIALGGQGAPLVPIGDFSLFGSQAESFLNLGGFANISYQKSDFIIAYDICPANLVLNKFAKIIANENFDKNGNLGKSGQLNENLLKALNNLDFYQTEPPKSLGVEWLEASFFPLIGDDFSVDNLTTVYHHIADQISENLMKSKKESVLVTGGGAKNQFLIELIQSKFIGGKVILPDVQIIDYKEAIIFAFLGALRLNNEVNILKSYTGASKDSCSGVVYF